LRRGIARTNTAEVPPPSSRTPARSADVQALATRPRKPRSSRTRRAARYAVTESGREGPRLLPISSQISARGRHTVIVRQSACRMRMRASS